MADLGRLPSDSRLTTWSGPLCGTQRLRRNIEIICRDACTAVPHVDPAVRDLLIEGAANDNPPCLLRRLFNSSVPLWP